MMRRFRVPEPKPDTLIVCWGRADSHSAPSFVYVYPDRAGKCDSRVLMDAIEHKQYAPDPDRFGSFRLEPSLAEELERRGYDLTTLKVSIKRKEPRP